MEQPGLRWDGVTLRATPAPRFAKQRDRLADAARERVRGSERTDRVTPEGVYLQEGDRL
ncbi:hypothetical protein GCM10023100_69970 [Actinocorallia cavernae]|uniref:Uncharacterized protein n=1 Tax=Actinocorallia cavernae TaxID=328075 RepID=A0ABP8T8G1_9ACTN|nr:hypothetical protein DV517_47580 [Streptomyces sp. S816]